VFRELGAVVEEMGPIRRPPAAPDVRAHAAKVDEIFAHVSLVPAPPGVVFRNRATLLTWLETHYRTLSDGLSYVSGRAAARVHVRVDQTAAREIVKPTGSAGAPVTAAVRTAVVMNTEAHAMKIFRALGHRAAAWKLLSHPPSHNALPATDGREPAEAPPSPLQPDRNGSQRDAADISASFLVDRIRWVEFTTSVAESASESDGISVAVTGPWPPYDFVRLQFGG
jgi:hypothetical protein